LSEEIYIVNQDVKIFGWQRLKTVRTMDSLCGSFELSYVGNDDIKSVLTGFEPIQLYLGEKLLMTGYIFPVKIPIVNDKNMIVIVGREKTADLIDCSAINKPGTWRNQTLQQIIFALVQPFGINVQTIVDTGDVFTKFSINHGEPVVNAIYRACNLRGVLPITDEYGDLLLTSASSLEASEPVKYGENILSGEYIYDYTESYSNYFVAGNTITAGVGWGSKSKINVIGEAEDTTIGRYRPFYVKDSDRVTKKDVRNKAAWMAQVRYGNASNLEINLSSYFQSNGDRWSPNLMVPVEIPLADIDTELLITQVEYTHSQNLQNCKLTIKDPLVYKQEPQPTIKKTVNSGWSL